MKIKRILMSSLVLTTFALSITLFQLSCRKEANAQTTTATLTKDQLLVEKCWKVDRLHHVIDGTYSSYIKGGANTTGIDYDKLRFTFRPDGSGTNVDQFGKSYSFKWEFIGSDKRSLLLTIPGLTSYTWDMLEIAGNYLHASVHLTISGNANNIETFRLIQIP